MKLHRHQDVDISSVDLLTFWKCMSLSHKKITFVILVSVSFALCVVRIYIEKKLKAFHLPHSPFVAC